MAALSRSVGYYDPCRNPAEVKINHERLNYWIERGAQPIRDGAQSYEARG